MMVFLKAPKCWDNRIFKVKKLLKKRAVDCEKMLFLFFIDRKSILIDEKNSFVFNADIGLGCL